jgi:hypothetical protein
MAYGKSKKKCKPCKSRAAKKKGRKRVRRPIALSRTGGYKIPLNKLSNVLAKAIKKAF